MGSDESDEEMEVDGGPAPPTTPTTPRALVKPPKHDLMMNEEVKILTCIQCICITCIYFRVSQRAAFSSRQSLFLCTVSKKRN